MYHYTTLSGLIVKAGEQVTFWTRPFFRWIQDGMTSLTVLFQQLDVIIEEQLEENGNVVHEVCHAQMTYFDYN